MEIERAETIFDDASHAIEQKFSQLDTGSDSSAPSYRINYFQSWVDGLGREVASARLGALSTPPVRPPIPPAPSNSVLLVRSAYNDRGEIEAKIDPEDREERYTYDDKGRIIEKIENYISPGTPAFPDAGCNRIVRMKYTSDDQMWELNVVMGISDNVAQLQTTIWKYGVSLGESLVASNKLVSAKVYADGTQETFQYNRQSEIMLRTEANGTSHRLIYDGLGRLRHDSAHRLGEQIYSPSRRLSHYCDPRDLILSAQSHSNPDPLLPSAINEIRYIYDGLGAPIQLFEEHNGAALLSGPHPTRSLSYTREGLEKNQNRVVLVTYPSGRTYRIDYGPENGIDDLIGRAVGIKEIDSGSEETISKYEYLGLTFLVTKGYPQPGLKLDLWGGAIGSYQGLDSFSRISDQRWANETTDVVRLEYAYNRGSQRTHRHDAIAASLGKRLDEVYAYDGLQQLKTLKRGQLNSSGDGLEPGTEDFNESWQYDVIGNWLQYVRGVPSPAIDQQRIHNQTNEITKFTGTSWPKPRYDETGNTTRLPGGENPELPFRVDYDAWNRVTRVSTFDPQWQRLRVAAHTYDANGRRAQSAIFRQEGTGSRLLETLDYYGDEQWRTIEEWSTAAPVPPAGSEGWIYAPQRFRALWVWDQAWGGFLDSLILRDRDTDDDGTADERRYALQDAHFNVVALCDVSGDIAERFIYTAFGEASFLSGAFDPSLTSVSNWTILFSGYPRDAWVGTYLARRRTYHALLGRWNTRDPIGEVGGINLYAFCGNDPINQNDLFGEISYTPPPPPAPPSPPGGWSTPPIPCIGGPDMICMWSCIKLGTFMIGCMMQIQMAGKHLHVNIYCICCPIGSR